MQTIPIRHPRSIPLVVTSPKMSQFVFNLSANRNARPLFQVSLELGHMVRPTA